MRRRGRTPAGAIRPGCVGGESRHEKPDGDNSDDVHSRGSCPVDDGRGNASLHLERLEERSGRSLPAAARWQACRHRTRGRPTARAACDLSRSERLSADRRSHAQARAGASGTDGLQERADDLRRRDRHGRSAVTRQPRPSLARLAGMSRRWRGRALSHELAIGRLSGRPLLWALFLSSSVIGKALPVWTREE